MRAPAAASGSGPLAALGGGGAPRADCLWAARLCLIGCNWARRSGRRLVFAQPVSAVAFSCEVGVFHLRAKINRRAMRNVLNGCVRPAATLLCWIAQSYGVCLFRKVLWTSFLLRLANTHQVNTFELACWENHTGQKEFNILIIDSALTTDRISLQVSCLRTRFTLLFSRQSFIVYLYRSTFHDSHFPIKDRLLNCSFPIFRSWRPAPRCRRLRLCGGRSLSRTRRSTTSRSR